VTAGVLATTFMDDAGRPVYSHAIAKSRLQQ
jgi:hypothetical protein